MQEGKAINVRLPKDVHRTIVGMKVRIGADSWVDFFIKLADSEKAPRL